MREDEDKGILDVKQDFLKYICILSVVNGLFFIIAGIWYAWGFYIPLAADILVCCYSIYRIRDISKEKEIETKAMFRAAEIAEGRTKKKR